MIRIFSSIFALTAAIFIAGCSSGSSDSGPATLAPPQSPVFIESTLQPRGKVKSNVEAITREIAGIGDLGGKIVAELESKGKEKGGPLDFAGEVEPWLGANAGIFLERFDGDDFKGYGVLIETTNPSSTQRFLDDRAKSGGDSFKSANFEGVDYEVDAADKTAAGVVGDFLVVAEDEKAFQAAVTASDGDSLAGEDSYSNLASEEVPGSLATVYMDVGRVVEGGEGEIDNQTVQLLEGAGIDLEGSTAFASVVPRSDTIEIDISGDFNDQGPTVGNAPKMLESLPADSAVALSGVGFGERLEEAVDNLDAEGVPGTLPPNQLKSSLKGLGVDLEAIAGSIGDVGVFAIGNSESNLNGAAVLATDDPDEAMKAVTGLGRLLRTAKTPGVTAVTANASGFSIRNPRLGSKPLVVAAKGERIAIGYGLPATLQGLASGSGATLADVPAYKQAVSALGSTPIGGFVDGSAAPPLVELLVPGSKSDYQSARKYLKKITYIAIGTVSPGDLANVKAIVGLEK